MKNASGEDREPTAAAELAPFTDGDFHALSQSCARDPQYNDRRLELRRKLLSLAKVAGERAAGVGVALEPRTSLHNPHAFNRMQVRRMWAYLCRGKPEKKRLRAALGAELGKDLDAAYRNAYLCAAVESESLEVSLRIHADAWFDGQNLVNRVKAEGLDRWRTLLNERTGYRLQLADWKGEWTCGSLTRERLEEFLKYYKPGEHSLVVGQTLPAPPGGRALATSPEMPERIVGELLALVPLYRYGAWSTESDFLFRHRQD